MKIYCVVKLIKVVFGGFDCLYFDHIRLTKVNSVRFYREPIFLFLLSCSNFLNAIFNFN